MAWITLALRKQTLKAEVNSLNYEDIQLSRKVRSVHRHLSYQQSVFNAAKTRELREVKAKYMEVRNARPDIDSDEYNEWQLEYRDAQEDYQEQKQNIEDYYDDLNEEIETEAQDEEDELQDQITTTETQRDAMSQELESIKEEIKEEQKNSAIAL